MAITLRISPTMMLKKLKEFWLIEDLDHKIIDWLNKTIHTILSKLHQLSIASKASNKKESTSLFYMVNSHLFFLRLIIISLEQKQAQLTRFNLRWLMNISNTLKQAAWLAILNPRNYGFKIKGLLYKLILALLRPILIHSRSELNLKDLLQLSIKNNLKFWMLLLKRQVRL